MNLKLYIFCIAAVLALVVPAAADNSTATIHGAVYKLDTFEPLDNTVIYVNSTPTQEMVAKNGHYIIELVPGNYNITAKYSQNGVLTYAIEKTIEIKDRENYVFDLLLPPVNPEGLVDGSNTTRQSLGLVTENSKPKVGSQILPKTGDVPVSSDLISNSWTLPTKQNRLYSLIVNYLLIPLTLLLLFVGGYQLSRKHKEKEKNTSQEGKKGHIIRDFFGLVNIPRISEKVLDKSIDLEKEEPAESKEEYQAPETEIVESGLEKENKKTSNEEPALNPEIETPTLKKELLLPEDLQKVVDIIKSHGGLITQKDLCSRSKYSEVKVSLMLSNLEKRKRIKKFKRGRENLVVLLDWKR
jgi:uncharacterized membrane protein